MQYKAILRRHRANLPDTDKGMLEAYLRTRDDMIRHRSPRIEILAFVQDTGNAFGETQLAWMRGDFVDAGML